MVHGIMDDVMTWWRDDGTILWHGVQCRTNDMDYIIGQMSACVTRCWIISYIWRCLCVVLKIRTVWNHRNPFVWTYVWTLEIAFVWSIIAHSCFGMHCIRECVYRYLRVWVYIIYVITHTLYTWLRMYLCWSVINENKSSSFITFPHEMRSGSIQTLTLRKASLGLFWRH